MSLTGTTPAAMLVFALFGTSVAAKELESADKKVRITIPDAWQPRDRGGAKEREVIRFVITTPGGPSTIAVVTDLHGGALTERGQAYLEFDSPGWKKRGHVEVRTEPVIHMIAHDGTEARGNFDAVFYRTIRGNLFSIWFGTTAGTYDKHRPVLAEIARSLDTDLPVFPRVPEGYRRMKSNGFLIFMHKSVKGKAKAIRRELAKGIKRFTATHGKPQFAGPALPQIIVLSSSSQRKDVGAESSDQEFEADWRYKRLFCKRLGKKATHQRIAEFRRELHELLFALAYGTEEPSWLCRGLGFLEQSHALCGRRLPAVAGNLYAKLPKQILEFSRMIQLEESDWSAHLKHGYGYAALLHGGPKKYRDALKDFLADLRETGDWRACERSHILTFDQTEMKADAQKFLRKLKSVKGK